MNHSSQIRLFALATGVWTTFTAFTPAIASSFGQPQRDFDQSATALELKDYPVVARTVNKAYRVIVWTRNRREQSMVRTLAPGAFRSSYRGQPVMQAGLFRLQSKAEEMHRRLRRARLNAVLVPSQIDRLPTNTGTSVSLGSSRPLIVPGGRIPLGNASGDADVYSVLPPPPPSSEVLLGPRYRVVVSPRGSGQQAKIRTLVPDAFRSFYRGRRVIQVGSFPTQREAQGRMQLMQRHGFNPIMERTQ